MAASDTEVAEEILVDEQHNVGDDYTEAARNLVSLADADPEALFAPDNMKVFRDLNGRDHDAFIAVLEMLQSLKARGKTSLDILRFTTAVYTGTSDHEDIPSSDGGINGLLTEFKGWLYVEENYNIVAPLTFAVANFCAGDPDIVGIVSPSGSIKTEIIRSLGEQPNQFVYPVSAITEHTLVSGFPKSDDLVPKLTGRLLCIKDMTTILSKNEDARSQIFADLRELTDGYISKKFGNGVEKDYRGIHTSILFASTNAIERYYSMYSNLGQRMLFIRPRNNPIKARQKSEANRASLVQMRTELHDAAMRFMTDQVQRAKIGLPTTSDETKEEMGRLYDFLALARTVIHHNYKGEIDEIPEPEFPTRIANSLTRAGEVHAMFYGRTEVAEEDETFLMRLILDNIPTLRWKILAAMTGEYQTTNIIAAKVDLPTGTTKRTLDELTALGLTDRIARESKADTEDRRADSYRLSDEAALSVYRLLGKVGRDEDKK